MSKLIKRSYEIKPHIDHSFKHGHSKPYPSKTYISWRGMIRRCYYSDHPSYKYYGGRGIKICERWLGKNGFINFLEDMGERPENTELDRKDNDKDYCKENCRWSTSLKNNRNKRNVRHITINKKTKTIKEWSEETGIKFITIHKRIQAGWSEEQAVTTPVMKPFGNL